MRSNQEVFSSQQHAAVPSARACCLLLLLTVAVASYAQKSDSEIGVGGAVIYNFQTEGFGAELRGDYHLNRHFAIVPEVSYFPSFNPIHELYAGLSGHYLFPITRNIDGYFALSIFYNDWINAVAYSHGEKSPNNMAPEGGGGLVRSRGCLRPFIESRWDAQWHEANLRIGLLWFFNSCKQKDCPAFKQ